MKTSIFSSLTLFFIVIFFSLIACGKNNNGDKGKGTLEVLTANKEDDKLMDTVNIGIYNALNQQIKNNPEKDIFLRFMNSLFASSKKIFEERAMQKGSWSNIDDESLIKRKAEEAILRCNPDKDISECSQELRELAREVMP